MAYNVTIDGEIAGTYRDAGTALIIAELAKRDEESSGRNRPVRITETPTALAHPTDDR